MSKKLNRCKLACAAFLVLAFALTVSTAGAEEKKAASALSGITKKAASMAESGSIGEMININNASPEMLSAIPGVGPKLAEAVTSYREANGNFSEIKDLLNVEGIDMSLLEKIKPFLKL